MTPAKPPDAVRPGDLVGVAALSSRVDIAALARGIAQLESLGFRTCLADNLESEWHLFAGDDAARVAGLHALVAKPEVKAVFFARGGHGVLRVLPRIDWELLGRNPKAYVGYSDLTPFLLQVVQRLGIISFHGPMVATDLASPLLPVEESSLLRALSGSFTEAMPCLCPDPTASPIEGPLLGGCLSMLVATLGTDYSPDLDGSLLFLEDVNEPLYRLDRMLTQLRLSGSLDHLKGMILGYLETSDPCEAGAAESLVELQCEGLGAPLAWGMESGHGKPNRTLPLGARARLDPAAGTLEVTS